MDKPCVCPNCFEVVELDDMKTSELSNDMLCSDCYYEELEERDE